MVTVFTYSSPGQTRLSINISCPYSYGVWCYPLCVYVFHIYNSFISYTLYLDFHVQMEILFVKNNHDTCYCSIFSRLKRSRGVLPACVAKRKSTIYSIIRPFDVHFEVMGCGKY